jgi:hypothetical protein
VPGRENQVKLIKMVGLAAVAALLAMAFVGASSAMAEDTALCSEDELVCDEANIVTHVHETSDGLAKLLSSPTVECNVLFLGDTSEGLSEGGPLHVTGAFTYSSCNNSCTVKEINGPALIEVLREGEHLASVVGEGEVELSCFFGFIKCVYNGENLNGHGLDPLTSSLLNGSIVISGQETKIVKGSCPEKAFLDITTLPLEKVYISE